MDHIIFGTGFTWTLPFLPQVQTRNNRVPDLYQHVFYRHDPTLTFVGAVSLPKAHEPCRDDGTNSKCASRLAQVSPSRSSSGRLLLLRVFSQVGSLFLLFRSRSRGRPIELRQEVTDRHLLSSIRNSRLISKSFDSLQANPATVHRGGDYRHLTRNGSMFSMPDMNDVNRCGDGRTTPPQRNCKGLF